MVSWQTVGSNLIHNFTAVTYSVKFAFSMEMCTSVKSNFLLILMYLVLFVTGYPRQPIFLSFPGNSVFLENLHESGCSYTYKHTHLMALFPGLPRWAGTKKVKLIWILLKQETVSGSGTPYASLQLSPDRQPHQHPTTLFFSGQMPFLLPSQQPQKQRRLLLYSKL